MFKRESACLATARSFRKVDWLSTFVPFVGTLAFSISLTDSFLDGLTTQGQNRLMWAPEGAAVPDLRAPRDERDLPPLPPLPAPARPRLGDRRRQSGRLDPLYDPGARGFIRPETS